ncbi:MAG TPA: hypothetical protein VFD63_19850 [Pyrinomonadaceae bacterium]|nr:hypothetical protein [Pyrinomonadaceae bacterium]
MRQSAKGMPAPNAIKWPAISPWRLNSFSLKRNYPQAKNLLCEIPHLGPLSLV